jgi:hypothetical protein
MAVQRESVDEDDGLAFVVVLVIDVDPARVLLTDGHVRHGISDLVVAGCPWS